ncbi:MAG: SDR family oxidoreductase [Thaumarchaeota archaeon]|nr:SDR family oxidoreductase [Nitrososphaerota archaeon]
MKLDGRVAIITGGNSGIGKATAILFAQEGAKVVVAGRNSSRGREVVDEIRKKGGDAVFVRTDVSKSEDVKNLVEKTVSRYGRIDVLFNNAALSPVGTVLTTSEKDWRAVIDTNINGTFLCTRYVLPHMQKRGGGAIINTGSINSLMAMKDEAAYDASKGGVLMLTRATALDFAKDNIRVNCICPGAIETPMLRGILQLAPNPKEAEAELVRKHALGRIGTPEEVARVALFLASDDSSFVTGTAVAVDGGMLGGWT